MKLTTSLAQVKGVGPKAKEQFALAGITTVGDLISFLPRRYDDFSGQVSIADVSPGKQTIRAVCESVSMRRVRRGLTVTTATLSDETGKLKAVWFNQPYRMKQLDSGDEFLFSGEFEFQYNRYQLTNPSVEQVKDVPVQTDRLLPVYRSIKGLKSQLVRKILEELRPLMSVLPETLPSEVVEKERLLSRRDAIRAMHFPTSSEDVTRARERLGFEEIFQLLLAAQLNRNQHTQLEGWHIPFDQAVVRSFVAQLPFELTGAQRRAAWDIIQDFEKKTPMNRLLQGDVGSGKTVVAGLAARQAAHSGFQTAIMAPTEILARQHADTLSRLLTPFGLTVGLLVGSVKPAAKRLLRDQIQSGEVDVVVGTHALLQDTVVFHRLGFVVIDEQHRFGVEQRQALLSKSAHLPHLLAMTATPIPRSLALTVYGELDVSVINERPKGRKEIITKLWSPNSRASLYEAVEQQLDRGHQAYVICSLIDDNPDNDIRSVQSEYDRLRNAHFSHRRIGLLHGRMKADEKDAVMAQFAQKELDILVSTTVVEVGVDVPNATVIVIENADRFGLSQLHQLRGRVGRSDAQSYAYLVMSDSKKPSERLREIETSNDGFYLAEVDLRLRGPGEVYGRAQHGALNLQIATLADTLLISRAKKQAERFAKHPDDLLHYEQLADQVRYYQRLTTLN